MMNTRVGRGRAVLAGLLFALLVAGGVPQASAQTYSFVRSWPQTWTFKFPCGVAADASGNVYVADRDNHRIQKFTSDGTFLYRWGSKGGGPGQFNRPIAVAVDASGNVYVADFGNQRIQKFTSGGIFVTQWGSPLWGTPNDLYVRSPVALAVDGSGNVYVVYFYGGRIEKFTSDGTFVTLWGSYNDYPSSHGGIAADASGNIYVIHVVPMGHEIEKFSSDGTLVTQWGGPGTGNNQIVAPRDLAVDGSGNVLALSQDRVQKFTPGGTFITAWGGGIGTGDGQFGLVINTGGTLDVDASGNVYVADSNNHRVQKFSSDGAFVTRWGSWDADKERFNFECGRAVDRSGNVYIADRFNSIQKFTSDGTFVAAWGGPGSGNGQFHSPQGIAVDSAGYVYVADTDNFRIQKFTSDGTFVAVTCVAAGIGPSLPWGVAVDGSDNVFVTDRSARRVFKFTSDGTFVTLWPCEDVDGQTVWPTGISVDGSGDVYVVDQNNLRVLEYAPPPTVTSITRVNLDPTHATSVQFMVSFNTAVTGVDASDFALTTTGVTGASVISVSADSGATRTVTVNSGEGIGTIRLDVLDDDTIVNATPSPLGDVGTGNGNFTTGEEYTALDRSPTVTLSSTVSALTDLGSIPVTVAFSKPVTGFTEEDVTVSNATIVNFAGDGTTYTFDLVPAGTGQVTATVDPGVAQSLSAIDNEAATSGINIHYSITGLSLAAWPVSVALLAAALYTLRHRKRAVT